MGGNAHYWPNNLEFNIAQDVAAARVVFGSKVPLVQIPCMGVASTFRVSGPELEHYLKGKNPLCDYLVQVTQTQALQDGGKCHMEQTDLGCYSGGLAYGGKL